MAHQSNITVGGHTVPVWEFDSTAQQIDNVVAALGAASPPQEALAALGAAVRPNLLDNAYFAGGGTGWGVFPVNQRGQTSYTPVFNGRVMDRWAVEADADLKVTLEPDGILLENTGSSNRQLKQIIPSGVLSVGNQYCISAMFDLIEGRSSVAIGEAVDPYETLGFVDLDNSGFAYKIVEPQKETEWKYIVYVYPGAKVKIKSVKLEDGSCQTLAYQDEGGNWKLLPQPDADYATQLGKCQRYFNQFNLNAYLSTSSFSGLYECMLQFPEMRIAPTITTIPDTGIMVELVTTKSALIRSYTQGSFITQVTLSAEL